MDSDAFSLGQLHARVTGLETRADKQEQVLTGIDKKLDDVLLALASAVGGRDRIRALMKYTMGIFTAIGACAGIIGAALHYLTVGIQR